MRFAPPRAATSSEKPTRRCEGWVEADGQTQTLQRSTLLETEPAVRPSCAQEDFGKKSSRPASYVSYQIVWLPGPWQTPRHLLPHSSPACEKGRAPAVAKRWPDQRRPPSDARPWCGSL